MGAGREARLLRSGPSGLHEVFRARSGTIYKLAGTVPVLTGPARAHLTSVGHQRIAGWVAAPGRYRLRVRYTPLWRVRAGRLCYGPARDGMTRLDMPVRAPLLQTW